MKQQLSLLLALALLLAVSLVRAPYLREQWLQHVPTVAALVGLAVAMRKRWLSTPAFSCLAAMTALHILGARWIYSYVPYEPWCNAVFGSGPHEWFGWSRNHYDRLVHLAFGLLMPLPIVEAVTRYGGLSLDDAGQGALSTRLSCHISPRTCPAGPSPLLERAS